MTEAAVNVENEVLKKKQLDNINVNAVVIKESPGRLIFVLESTHRELVQTNVKLKTTSRLKIRHKGNIFQPNKIVFPTMPKSPKHPIIYTSFLMQDPDYKIPFTGFDNEIQEPWKHATRTPEEYAKSFYNPLVQTIRSENGYSEMILENSSIPSGRIEEQSVTSRYLGTCYYDGFACEQYVLLETSYYFSRRKFPVEKGCILKDDLH